MTQITRESHCRKMAHCQIELADTELQTKINSKLQQQNSNFKASKLNKAHENQQPAVDCKLAEPTDLDDGIINTNFSRI
jgi:hypothetical protein